MSDNKVRCPHGIECEYVHRTRYFHGQGDIVVGGDYWHNEDEKCAGADSCLGSNRWGAGEDVLGMGRCEECGQLIACNSSGILFPHRPTPAPPPTPELRSDWGSR